MVEWYTGKIIPTDLYKKMRKAYIEIESEFIMNPNQGGMDMWLLPPHIGKRVILNPEGENYKRYNERQAKGSAGYILSFDYEEPVRWIKLDETDRRQVSVRIRWDNGHINSYRLKDVLPVEVEKPSFVNITFKDGDELIGTMDTLEEEIDRKIIKQGIDIRQKTEINQEYIKSFYTNVFKYYKHCIERGRVIDEFHAKVYEELLRLGYDKPVEETNNPFDELLEQITGEPSVSRRARPIIHPTRE